MRLLITSDTHRDTNSLEKAIKEQPKAEIVIHLGDIVDDVEIVKYKFHFLSNKIHILFDTHQTDAFF